MISKWKHPIRYWRLVTTPTCEKCKHHVCGIALSKDRCTCEKYLEHANRLNGTEYRVAEINLVRGTRWCDFEPIEEGDDE
ncbi:hypothetical protein [Senegalimassilia anaerobia]